MKSPTPITSPQPTPESLRAAIAVDDYLREIGQISVNSIAEIVDAEFAQLRRERDELLQFCHSTVAQEAKADALRESGMVDFVDIKALRGLARKARELIASTGKEQAKA